MLELMFIVNLTKSRIAQKMALGHDWQIIALIEVGRPALLVATFAV